MNRRLSALLGSVLGTAGLFIAVPHAAYAQSAQQPAAAPEEIVVTAQRREEKALDVPITVTALSAQTLATANVQNLSDIQQISTSVRFTSQSQFYQPTIRGIGTGITTSGGGSNVGIYVDGFYSPNPIAADTQFLNVQNVQVLKGPQGTLFGHNTTGGAILIVTSDPSNETHAQATIDYGRFNAQRYQGYVTTGLNDNVSMDLAAVIAKGNGFITNIDDNDHDVGAYQNWSVRTGFKFQFGDAWSVLLRYTHESENDPTPNLTNSNTDTSINPTTGQPWGLTTFNFGPGTYTTNPSQVANAIPQYNYVAVNNPTMTIKGDLGFADFTSYTQFREEDNDADHDLGNIGVTIFNLGLPIVDRTWTQEFLFNSKPGPRLQWTAGAFFMSYKDEYFTFIDNGCPCAPVGGSAPRIRLGGSSTDTQTLAPYADATYQVADKLFLTGGVRVSRDSVIDAYWNTSFTNLKNFVPSIHSWHAAPRAVIRYTPDDTQSIYASYNRGYKAAIIDVGGSCQDSFDNYVCNPIKPETVDAFEVGYKINTHGFSNELAAFYYNYNNLQVSEYLGNAQAYIVNAARSHIYGVEDEVHYDVTDNIQLNGGVGWTHARYVQFGNAQVGAPIYATCPANPLTLPVQFQPDCTGGYDYVNTSTILHNVHMQNTPDFTATFGPRFTTGMTDHGEFSLSTNLYYTSAFYYSPSGTEFRQPAYATLALRGQWDDPAKKYFVAVYGTNVTDERYRVQVEYNGFGVGAQWSAPIEWGLQVGAKF